MERTRAQVPLHEVGAHDVFHPRAGFSAGLLVLLGVCIAWAACGLWAEDSF